MGINRLLNREFAAKALQFSLLFFLFFLSSFVYNILLPLKKTLIIYIPGAGAESIAYLKPFFITPGSFLMAALFLFLSSRFNQNTVFRAMLGFFTGYFVLYRFVLLPWKPLFLATALVEYLLPYVPVNLQAVMPLIEYWMDTVFYTLAELWGSTIVSLLIWGVVNQSMTRSRAESEYGILTIGANSSAIASGSLSLYLGKIASKWDLLVSYVLNATIFSCLLAWILYEVLMISGGLSTDSVKKAALKVEAKKSYGLLSAFQKVYSHRRLWAIGIIVIGYQTLYTLSEFMFMKQVELYYGASEKIQSNALLSEVSLYTGVCATLFALFAYPLAMRWGGWLWAALLAPLFFLTTALSFYGAEYLSFYSTGIVANYSALMTGAFHIAVLRGARYSVFDATKESAYVGLSQSDQVQGKAAIDTIVSRFGRTLGSFIYCILFAFIGNSITAAVPYIIILSMVGVVYWIRSIVILNNVRNEGMQTISSDSPHMQPA